MLIFEVLISFVAMINSFGPMACSLGIIDLFGMSIFA